MENQETIYHDGYETKSHTNFFRNALDCVAYIGDDLVLNAQSGLVWDGTAEVHKLIEPNTEREEEE